MTRTKKASWGTNLCLIQKLDTMLKNCFEYLQDDVFVCFNKKIV